MYILNINIKILSIKTLINSFLYSLSTFNFIRSTGAIVDLPEAVGIVSGCLAPGPGADVKLIRQLSY